ncbi:thioredoxin family protein [Malacoplasma muris]|uniref:thioredoxin family protein n=1 Tax=Malacoplasma muris TaxID=2119 RepID=UPI00398EF46D
MSKLEIGNDKNLEELTKQTQVAIVKFGATWCGPCKMIAPELEDIANNYGHITIVDVDIDNSEAEQIVAQYNVQMVPTVVFFRKGKEVERFVGYKPKDFILDIIKKYEN